MRYNRSNHTLTFLGTTLPLEAARRCEDPEFSNTYMARAFDGEVPVGCVRWEILDASCEEPCDACDLSDPFRIEIWIYERFVAKA